MKFHGKCTSTVESAGEKRATFSFVETSNILSVPSSLSYMYIRWIRIWETVTWKRYLGTYGNGAIRLKNDTNLLVAPGILPPFTIIDGASTSNNTEKYYPCVYNVMSLKIVRWNDVMTGFLRVSSRWYSAVQNSGIISCAFINRRFPVLSEILFRLCSATIYIGSNNTFQKKRIGMKAF